MRYVKRTAVGGQGGRGRGYQRSGKFEKNPTAMVEKITPLAF